MAWHKCTVCGKRFAFLKSLEDHQRTHAMAPSYKCDMCGEEFNSLAPYHSHMSERHHESSEQMDLSFALEASENKDDTTPPPPFKGLRCDNCTKKFSTTTSLERHNQRKHHRSITCSQERKCYHIKDYKLGRSLIIARTVR